MILDVPTVWRVGGLRFPADAADRIAALRSFRRFSRDQQGMLLESVSTGIGLVPWDRFLENGDGAEAQGDCLCGG